MVSKRIAILSFLCAILADSLAGGPAAAGEQSVEIVSLSEEAIERLSDAKIYFGHQSVGNNIMQGVQDLMGQDLRLKLNIVETESVTAPAGGIFAHGPVGRNQDPVSKIDDFSARIKSGLGTAPDIAFFKFCYIDIKADSDIETLFSRYQKTMVDLKRSYPDVTFVHVTVPLTVVQTGPKAIVKKWIARAPGGYLENIRRNEYNQLVRQKYGDREPVFDLARIESTHSEGMRETFDWQGNTYEGLIPEYASDGRHLNEAGRRRIAEKLLVFLSNALSKSPTQKTQPTY